MNITVITLKAFGDFVIACNATRRVQSITGMDVPGIVAGEHVRSLASAIGLDITVQFIGDSSWIDVPAAFDVRKRGVFSALRSLYDIRHRLDEIPSSNALVFDHLGWRERLVGGGRPLNSLPAESRNIYLAYDRFFESLGYETLNDGAERKHAINRAIIIPGARMGYKVIPAQVISNVAVELERRGINVSVVVLEGESIDLPGRVVAVRLPRSFDSLVAAIKASDLVISADSLPSHLSEFLNVPIFVSTSVPKPYWLPRSAYLTNGWATFADVRPLSTWLDKYLCV